MINKKYYTEKEIATILGISSDTVRTWRHRERGPSYVKSEGTKGKVLYPIEDFEKWLSDQKVVH